MGGLVWLVPFFFTRPSVKRTIRQKVLHHCERAVRLVHWYHVARPMNLHKREEHVDRRARNGASEAGLDEFDVPWLVSGTDERSLVAPRQPKSPVLVADPIADPIHVASIDQDTNVTLK